ncbi:hypothetical protein WJX72_006970 [[Myrmecia] bisecta]|uniref:Beclin 1 n=1 Tax=[Myrmecia] bisecta TaxID=41462 RepID=A0AAW1QR95_9CHLO
MEQVFHCQSCRAKLNIIGIDNTQHEGVSVSHRQSSLLGASAFGGSKVDESFVLLDSAGRRGQPPSDAHASGSGHRSLDESFVMLAGSASVLKQAPSGMRASSHGIPMQALDDRFAQLAKTFEIASGECKVDQPLCLDCSTRVREEVDAAVAEAEADIAAYESALDRLTHEEEQPMSRQDFEEEMRQAHELEAQERQRAQQLQQEASAAEAELADLKAASAELSTLEERYWHDFNDFQLQLRSHVEERDVVISKIERTNLLLERLRRTNVYNDVFHIWYDGPFGTIGGFRMGKTPTCPVEWDEINAAWGQAVLLLHTMAQACKLNFSCCRLLPLGSYPRVADKRSTLDLHGPVNKLYCTSYDRAMTLFLSCLNEFADFAKARDSAEGKRETFELPYAVDADRVGGMTIKLMFNKDAKWTKALKFMLTDLKWCLKWVIAQQDGAGLSTAPVLAA